jgi:UDP-glucose 4-epimerase
MLTNNPTVVVTGHGGYIGQILSRSLLESGYNVIGVDRKYVSPDSILPIDSRPNGSGRVHLYSYQGDLDNDHFLHNIRTVYNVGKLSGIVHLAADSLLGPSVKAPIPYFLNNVGSSTKFLEFLLKKNIRTKFIFSSSAAVYGDHGSPGHPIHTYDTKDPINPYGRTKLHFEEVLDEAGLAHQFKSTSFRFFNVVGGYEELGQGIDQPHIMPSIFRAYVEGKPVVLNGDNYHTHDGTPVRDYIHVLDVVDAILYRLQNDDDLFPTVAKYNLCTGKGTSNLQLVEAVKALLLPQLEVTYDVAREGDPAYLIGDPYDLEPWRPSRDLNSMILSAFSSFEEQDQLTRIL